MYILIDPKRIVVYSLKQVMLSITDRCNLHCDICDVPLLRRPEMSLNVIRTLINDMNELNVKILNISGGEPLLRKDIFKIIRYANSFNIKVRLSSNGTLINEEIAKRLKISGVDSVTISIDGPRDIHERIRGRGTFDKAIMGIKNLKVNGINVTIATTVNKKNYMALEDIIKLAKKLRITHVFFQPFDEIFVNEKMRKFKIRRYSIKNSKKLKKVIVKILYLTKMYNIITNPPTYLKSFPEFFSGELKFNRSCFVPFTSISISTSGEVLPCWSKPEIVVGNLTKDRLTKIWNSKKYKNILKKLKNCNSCLLSCYGPIYRKEA